MLIDSPEMYWGCISGAFGPQRDAVEMHQRRTKDAQEMLEKTLKFISGHIRRKYSLYSDGREGVSHERRREILSECRLEFLRDPKNAWIFGRTIFDSNTSQSSLTNVTLSYSDCDILGNVAEIPQLVQKSRPRVII